MHAWRRGELCEPTLVGSHAHVTALSRFKPPSLRITILVQHTLVHYPGLVGRERRALTAGGPGRRGGRSAGACGLVSTVGDPGALKPYGHERSEDGTRAYSGEATDQTD